VRDLRAPILDRVETRMMRTFGRKVERQPRIQAMHRPTDRRRRPPRTMGASSLRLGTAASGLHRRPVAVYRLLQRALERDQVGGSPCRYAFHVLQVASLQTLMHMEQSASTDGLCERKKLATRRATVAAALGLFEERGFDATSIPAIAKAADVSSRTVSYHFPANEQILFAGDLARSLRLGR
jgi:hypothetical protein